MNPMSTLLSTACTVLVVTAAVMALPQVATAEPSALGPPHAHYQERLREVRGKVLRQQAKFDEAAAVKTEKVLNQFDEDRKAAHGREADARKALSALVKADSRDEKVYKDALDALVVAHEAVVKLRVRELEELRKSLGQRDAARVVVALPAIQRELRQEMKEGRKAWLRDQLQRLEGDDDGPDAPTPPPQAPPPRAKKAPGQR